MDGNGDDWELDDWEDEAFDEDVWDDHQLDLEDPATAGFGDEDPEDDAYGDAGFLASEAWADDPLSEDGIATTPEPTQRVEHGGGRMGWDPWDVGTIFALGGWLADHHAESTARQVAAVLAERDAGRDAAGRPIGASHPPPPSGYPYDTARGTLAVGDPLDQGRLYAELATAATTGRELMIQAEGPDGAGGPLLLYLSAVPLSSGPRLWVVAEERPGGFQGSRLIPVFEPHRSSGAAIFATDHPSEAADAAVWACGREGVSLAALTVTVRR